MSEPPEYQILRPNLYQGFGPEPCYRNSIPQSLNAAARLIFGLRKFDHITEILRDILHRLQVRERVDFKLCLLVYKARHGLAPDYIAAVCNDTIKQLISDSATGVGKHRRHDFSCRSL